MALNNEEPMPTSRAARAGMPVSLRERAAKLQAVGGFIASPLDFFEKSGRLQFATLVQHGLYPSSKVLDVGCGPLRAGYWLMNFLEPGCYFGIEPRAHEIEEGLAYIVEPELIEYARPTFAHNDDFDLTVFGTRFNFVIARSVWTHTSKEQNRRMLDTFCEVAEPGAVMLVSYLPASRLPEVLQRPWSGLLARIPKANGAVNRLLGRMPRRPDYRGDEWQVGNVSHSYAWIAQECKRRGLAVRELDYGIVGSQVWLRIDHP
jgi:hypothetical protein